MTSSKNYGLIYLKKWVNPAYDTSTMKMRVPLGILLLCLSFLQAQQTPKAIADSLFQLGNYAKAINYYAKVGTAKAEHQIARAYQAMGNLEKAISQYQRIIKKDSTAIPPQFELGKLYDKTKDYEAAKNLFTGLTKRGTDNPEFYFYLGKSLQRTLGSNKAVNAYKKAVALDSTHLRSIYALGRIYLRKEQPSNAFEIIDIGLTSAPNDVALLNLKALNHFNLGDYQEAAIFFQRLIELKETKPFVWKKLGYSHTQTGEYEGAKKAYKALEEIPNQEGDAYFGLGEVFLKEQQLDSAEIYMKKAIEERRYVFDKEYRNLGRIARLKGDLKEALDYYTKAWQEDTTNQFAHWQVCVLADKYYKDPKTKLNHYETLVSANKNLAPFLKERAQKRIKELKTEIHYTTD